MEHIKSKIRTIPHFPKEGIMFRDITTLLKDPQGLQDVVKEFVKRYRDKEIDVVVGVESRGFIIGGILAHELGAGFVPVRKAGKLPGKTRKIEYELEYGKDALEIHEDAIHYGQRVLLIDDLIATAGTCRAAIDLIKGLGGEVIECAFIVELPDLKGREKIPDIPLFSLVCFEGD